MTRSKFEPKIWPTTSYEIGGANWDNTANVVRVWDWTNVPGIPYVLAPASPAMALVGDVQVASVIDDGLARMSSSGSGGSGGNVPPEGSGDIPDLSSKAMKHPINDHMLSKYAQQLKYQSKEAVEIYLDKKSFFNPSWTEEQVKVALNQGYKDAISKGVTDGYHSYDIYGETIQIYIREGKFSTGFGSHKLSYEDLLKFIK